MPRSAGGTFLDIQVTGHRDVMGRFVRASGEIVRAHREEMRELGRRIDSALQREAPVKTGRLRKGITFKTYDSGSSTELKVSSEAPYTKWVIRGRGPVVAKRAKVLRFEIDGRILYRRRVGPAKANPFPRRALSGLSVESSVVARRMAARVLAAYEMR